MDTKKLRQKILDLAIRGKLVPQDPNDEPASVLLERIRAEKERLIKEGKIKRSKKSATGDEIEAPFEIPESWEWATIGDVSETCLGKMLDKQKNLGRPQLYLRNVNVRWGAFDLSDLLQMPFEDDEEERYSICYNDLVVYEGGEPGRCAIWKSEEPIKFQKALHRIRCCHGILNQYLQIILRLYSQDGTLKKYFTGSTIKHLTGDSLNSILFPLPPIAEQQRIANEVERWFAVIDELENNEGDLLKAIDQAKTKILDLAIHGKLVPQDPNDESAIDLLKRINPKLEASKNELDTNHIPRNWCWTTIGSIFSHNTGKALNKSDSQEGLLLPYITTSNVYWNRFDLSETKKMFFKDSEIDKCTVSKGDLLVCEGGDIGRSAIWNFDYDICIQNHIHRLRAKGEISHLLYLYVLMYYKLTDRIRGKGIGLQGLSSGLLDKMVVPLPPYQEQLRIVAKIEELFAVLDGIKESLE